MKNTSQVTWEQQVKEDYLAGRLNASQAAHRLVRIGYSRTKADQIVKNWK